MGAPAVAEDPRIGLPVRSPTRLALWLIGALGVGAAGASFLVALTSESVSGEVGEPFVMAFLSNWVTVSFVSCGLVAWSRRPESRFGPLMVVAGAANFVNTLVWADNDLLHTVGQAVDFVPPVLFLHVFLAYPTGLLVARSTRLLVAAAYVVAVGMTVAGMTLGGFDPRNLLRVTEATGAAEVLLNIQLLTLSALLLCGVAVLILRRHARGRPLRRSVALLNDAFMLGLAMIAVLFLFHVIEGPAVRELRWAAFATLGLAPLAFLVGLLHERLARSAVGDLLVALPSEPAPSELRDALARALRDPSLTLVYWLPEFDCYADQDGTAVELPSDDPLRAVNVIERDAQRVAALIHDPALSDEPELLEAVTAAAGIALENGRLHAELRARLAELRGSRARIVEAGQAERKRLERNLHDGAQQRLIALSLELGLLADALPADAGERARLDAARREIATSLEELRAVARGLHPAVVSGHGLEVALEQLTARAAVPVELTVELGSRLDERVEVAAYYIVSESLANIGKHARATSAAVHLSVGDASVVIVVSDDGVGGADTQRGSGLRGLADRVEALDGRLRVWSPSGGGTRVRAEIPCES